MNELKFVVDRFSGPGCVLRLQEVSWETCILLYTVRVQGAEAPYYERVEDFLGFGGIRIEDDMLVTEDGARILGPDIPKAPGEVADRAGSSRTA